MRIAFNSAFGLWCREDGAVLMPPTKGSQFKKHRWTYGSCNGQGYPYITYHSKRIPVHRLIAETFLSNPLNFPTVDHIDRNRANNRIDNLRWASYKMQSDNSSKVIFRSKEIHTRQCDDRKQYMAEYARQNKDHIHAYLNGYYVENRQRIVRNNAIYYAKMKDAGFVKRRCADGRQRWVKIA